mmetsp:Transcript_1429/g.2727  ORF Transcript_1429/g.2727 Transcript_1429/m.2727 type:complete len:273 (+) Transcript_1429:2534-3352(+)
MPMVSTSVASSMPSVPFSAFRKSSSLLGRTYLLSDRGAALRPLAFLTYFASSTPTAYSVSRPWMYFAPDEHTPLICTIAEAACLLLRNPVLSSARIKDVLPTPEEPRIATLHLFHVIFPCMIFCTIASASSSAAANRVRSSSLSRAIWSCSSASSLSKLRRQTRTSCWLLMGIDHAMSRAEIPLRLRMSASASPSCTKYCTTTSRSFLTASIRAVMPLSSLSSTSAPYFSIKNLMGSMWPIVAACISAVWPFESRASTSAPSSSTRVMRMSI